MEESGLPTSFVLTMRGSSNFALNTRICLSVSSTPRLSQLLNVSVSRRSQHLTIVTFRLSGPGTYHRSYFSPHRDKASGGGVSQSTQVPVQKFPHGRVGGELVLQLHDAVSFIVEAEELDR